MRLKSTKLMLHSDSSVVKSLFSAHWWHYRMFTFYSGTRLRRKSSVIDMVDMEGILVTSFFKIYT